MRALERRVSHDLVDPLAVAGRIEHLALWDRALSDEEVTAISGGAAQAARRDAESLILVGRNAPYMRFYPKKTRSGKEPRPCILPNIDRALLGYFASVEKEFPDCPYYFPRIRRNKLKGTAKWFKAGNWRKAFSTVCKNAQITDFHIHDLRHEAFTWAKKTGD